MLKAGIKKQQSPDYLEIWRQPPEQRKKEGV